MLLRLAKPTWRSSSSSRTSGWRRDLRKRRHHGQRAGRIIESCRLAADRELQQRLGRWPPFRRRRTGPPHGQPGQSRLSRQRGEGVRRADPDRRSNPAPPALAATRAQRAHGLAALIALAGPGRIGRAYTQRRGAALRAAGGHRRRDADTKGVELRFIRDLSLRGLRTRLVDVDERRSLRDVTGKRWRSTIPGGWRCSPKIAALRSPPWRSVRDLDQSPKRHCGHQRRGGGGF